MRGDTLGNNALSHLKNRSTTPTMTRNILSTLSIIIAACTPPTEKTPRATETTETELTTERGTKQTDRQDTLPDLSKKLLYQTAFA